MTEEIPSNKEVNYIIRVQNQNFEGTINNSDMSNYGQTTQMRKKNILLKTTLDGKGKIIPNKSKKLQFYVDTSSRNL